MEALLSTGPTPCSFSIVALFSAIFAYLWPLLATLGYFWLLLTTSDSFRLLLATFG